MVPDQHGGEARPPGSGERRVLTLERALWVVAILTALVAGVLPRVGRAQISSNETAAIGTLRTLSTSEAGFESAAIVDVDGDGTGEFGFLSELAGVTGYRSDPRGPTRGVVPIPTSPAFITSVLGTTAVANGGIAEKRGYYFLVYLPTEAGPAVAETGVIAPGVPQDANDQEVRFACYAWPVALGRTGRRAFVVSQQGEVFATANDGYQDYDGLRHRPPPEAAYVASVAEDPRNLEGQFVAGVFAADGFGWLPAGN